MSYIVRPFRKSQIAPPEHFADFRFPPGFGPESGKPLDVEIGCGVGWHPIRYALENSDRQLIAIEHTRERFEKFHLRWTRNQLTQNVEPNRLTNLLPIHADAVRWITHALPPGSVSRFFILFPNPEPKAPNKRWIRMPFFAQLLLTLRPGGEITIATNEESYFKEVLEFAENAWHLSVIEARIYKANNLPSGLPRTHFEKKYLLRGETCFDVRLSKP